MNKLSIEQCSQIAEEFFNSIDKPLIANCYCEQIGNQAPVLKVTAVPAAKLIKPKTYIHSIYGHISIEWKEGELVHVE